MTSQLEKEKGRLVKEIFIDTADEDYITARWLFLSNLHRQFFWGAAQSLEKYLKAALLLNGYSAKQDGSNNKYRHNLAALFDAVNRFAGNLIPSQLEAPVQVALFSQNKKLWGDPTTKNFISRINEHGDPSNRYDYFGFELEAADLYKFDQVVFALRNIAVKLDAIFDANHPTKTFADRIREHPNQQLYGFGKHLIAQSNAQPNIYESACENNFPFAPKTFEHQELPLTIRGTVSRLEILFKNGQMGHSAQLQRWVEENMLINKHEIERLVRL